MSTIEETVGHFTSTEKNSDDILKYLNKKFPDEDLFISEPSIAVDLNSDELFKRISQQGQFTQEDLKELLIHEEQLLETVHFLVSENARVNSLVNKKEDKVIAGVELINNQRQWIHSLLEDNVTIREEVEVIQEDRDEINSSQVAVLSVARNERDQWRDKYDGTVEKVNDLTYLLEDKEKQQNKMNGDMKKMNIHKKALLEQISQFDFRHKKNKMYIGMLASAATLMFALFLGSIFNENNEKNKIDSSVDGLTKIDAVDKNNKKKLFGGAIETSNIVKQNGNKDKVEIFEEEDRTKLLSPKDIENIFGPAKGDSIKNNIVEEGSSSPKKGSELVENKKKKVQYYIVKRNDSIWKISEKFYGTGKYVNRIKRENKLKRILRPGTKLIITALDED
ncbi:MAG: hypothetical protein COA79_24380 [Planctomycetota bacterium]|nr:MAG: hypothetical protein COA79_24380 [Planctomycetota bacterium]